MRTQASLKTIMQGIHRALRSHFWPPTIEADFAYEKYQDDNDGNFNPDNCLGVYFDEYGDAYISIGARTLRFRHGFGGGASLRTRNALMILALAIKEDYSGLVCQRNFEAIK